MNSVNRLFGLVIVMSGIAACTADTVGSTASPPPAAAVARGLRVEPSSERTGTARSGLSALRDLSVKHGDLGLGESDRAGAALGEEIPIYFASAEAIDRAREGGDLHAVLGEPVEMLHTVVAGGIVKSAVVLGRRSDGAWVVTGVGRAKLARDLADATVRLAERGAGKPVALVTVPASGERFVAYEAGGHVELTALDETKH
jgi:hypothetical protein